MRLCCDSRHHHHQQQQQQQQQQDRYGWIVDGFDKQTGKPFRYRCKRVVLATGTTDLSNQLGVAGEDSQLDWVTHDLNKLESRLDHLISHQQHGTRNASFLFSRSSLSFAKNYLILDYGKTRWSIQF